MGKLVISTNNRPDGSAFADLMKVSTRRLNDKMSVDESKYLNAKPDAVEDLVCKTMTECAVGTPFEGSISLVSGHRFPDILAGKYYGTEVKSTKSDKWDSFGNSIFENTRLKDVERIYVTFGKMIKPVRFKSKPYEDCISGVVVDHSPRYHIDMTIQEEGRETIFEVMRTTYDEFRRLPVHDQIEMIAKKSKEKLAKGETLWWHPEVEEYIAPPSIRLMSAFSKEDKERLISEAYCFFPELFGSSSKKYNRYVLWLITDKSIATGNARDGFSSGGQVEFQLKDGSMVKIPATIGRLIKYHEMIANVINKTPSGILKDRWNVSSIQDDRISQWIGLILPVISDSGRIDRTVIEQVLESIF